MTMQKKMLRYIIVGKLNSDFSMIFQANELQIVDKSIVNDGQNANEKVWICLFSVPIKCGHGYGHDYISIS